MKHKYNWQFEGITKDGEHMTDIQVARELNALNAKAHPEPEEVRVSLGTVYDMADFNGVTEDLDPDIRMCGANMNDVYLTHVVDGGSEWIEIDVPEVAGSRDIPYLYADADDASGSEHVPDCFRWGFMAARMVKP